MKKRPIVYATIVIVCAVVGALAFSVRADAPAGHFTDLGDGTVRDTKTELVWQKEFSPSTQTQSQSVAYCTSLTTAGGGWRLPTVLELRSIVDDSGVSPAIDVAVFPDTPTEFFWSGQVGYSYWGVHFETGWVVRAPTDAGAGRARCVRW